MCIVSMCSKSRFDFINYSVTITGSRCVYGAKYDSTMYIIFVGCSEEQPTF